ncbi:cell envelope integrity protein TolA, partial [Sabulicella glaciei]
ATPAPPRPTPPLPLPPPPTPPPPEPAQTPGTGQTPPVRNPAERSQSVLNTLERLQAAQRQTQPPTARPNPAPGAPQQGGGVPQGTANLTASERAGLADKISECWSVDAGAPGLNQISVELRVEVDAGGVVRVVRPNGSPPSEPRARMVYEAARRALLDPRCNPLPLPRERLAALRDAVFRFRPSDLGLR